MQTKELDGGHKLTFMKFTFQSPALEIKAPVLNDKTVGYQVLQQNGACVFLSRIFNIPALPAQVYFTSMHCKGQSLKHQHV